jgi:DNA-binding PadR family transcriptional regulator
MSPMVAQKRIKTRRKKVSLENLPVPNPSPAQIENIARILNKQIERENFAKKYAAAGTILKLVGAGVFLAASLAIPNLPLALKPFLTNPHEYEVWKRFNIPYLKRSLKRLQAQKLVEVAEGEGMQVVRITNAGRRKVLKYALDELVIEKPKNWDRKWRLVSYDIPANLKSLRNLFRDYLKAWGFYPLQESVFLHAYPCENEIEFLREYLGVGEFVRIFTVSKIENDASFRQFFDV